MGKLDLVLQQVASMVATMEVRTRIPDAGQSTRGKQADEVHTRNWLSFLRDRTGLHGILALQRALEPECFYRDVRDKRQHSGKWSHYQTGYARPSEDQLMRVNLIVPGSYQAFYDPVLRMLCGPKLCFPGHWHAKPFLPVIARREGLGWLFRPYLRKQEAAALLSYRSIDSLVYTTRYLWEACMARHQRLIKATTSWLYAHVLINALELHRRGILHEVLVAFDRLVFSRVRWTDRFAWADPAPMTRDAALLHLLPFFCSCRKADDWSDADLRKMMARIVMGDVGREYAGLIEVTWLHPEAQEIDDIASETIARYRAAKQLIHRRHLEPMIEAARKTASAKANAAAGISPYAGLVPGGGIDAQDAFAAARDA